MSISLSGAGPACDEDSAVEVCFRTARISGCAVCVSCGGLFETSRLEINFLWIIPKMPSIKVRNIAALTSGFGVKQNAIPSTRPEKLRTARYA